MVEIINETTANATQNATENATSTIPEATGTAPAQDPGLLGPLITAPTELKIAAFVVAGLGFAVYWFVQNRDTSEKLEATDWEQKIENLIKSPVENVGRSSDTILYNRTDVSGKRQIGKIVRLDSNSTATDMSASIPNDAEVDESDVREETEYVSYAVVKGSSKLSLITNTVLYKLARIVSSGSNSQAEYFDLPKDEIQVTDDGVEIKEEVKLTKKHGLWQSTSHKAQERLNQLTWLSTHQNWTNSLQKQPEFYSDLNMNISGIKNIENQKSENMKDYKKAEKKAEKEEAMS